MNTTTCPKCGVDIYISDFPFCPHGKGSTVQHPDVTFPGGIVIDALGREPIYSETERRQRMAALGLREAVYHIPNGPDTDRSNVTKSWDTMDPYTMAQAQALVARVASAKATDRADGSLETLEVGWADAPPASFRIATER